MSMEMTGKAISAVAAVVQNGYTTATEKMYPTLIFTEIDVEWQRASDREKITLLQKLNRGFLDGLIPAGNIPKLLDAVEATIPAYPISPLTLDQINLHLASQIPALYAQPALRFRTIKAMYLLRPRSLAQQVTNNVFVVNVPNPTERENIANTTIQNLISADDATGVNELVSAVQQNPNVTLGETAKKTLIAYLSLILTKTTNTRAYVISQSKIQDDGNGEDN